jgi:hypothetical protein
VRVPASILLATLAVGAVAQDVSVDVDLLQGRYIATESAPGSSWVLDKESGQLRGVAIEAKSHFREMYLGFRVDGLHGDIDYDGHTQFFFPLHTTTSLRISRARLRLGFESAMTNVPVSWDGGAMVGQQEIYRDIRSTPISRPLTETMLSDVVGADAELRWSPGFGDGSWGVAVKAAVQRPWRQTLSVDTHGAYDNFTLTPEIRTWYSSALTVRKRFTSRWQIEVARIWERIRFGSATGVLVTRNGQLAAIGSYPGSTQSLDLWSLAVRCDLW